MIHDSAITTYKNPEFAPWALGPSSNFVLATDPRLADARVPLAHTHAIGDVAGLQAALNAAANAVVPDSAALSVTGRSANSAGPLADIAVSVPGVVPALFGYDVTADALQFTLLAGGFLLSDGASISSRSLVAGDIFLNGTTLLGRGAGFGGDGQEITLGTNLSMSGTTLNVLDVTKDFLFLDDFMNAGTGAGNMNWTTTLTGSASFAALSAANNHPGELAIVSGTTAVSGGVLQQGTVNVLVGGGALRCDIICLIEALSTGAQTYTLRLGLGDSAVADFTDGIYFEYDSTVSANWRIVTAQGATRTKTSTATAVVAGAFMRLTFTVDAGTSEVRFYVDGTEVSGSPITTNIPGAAQYTSPILQFLKTVGVTSRYVVFDLFSLRQTFTTPR